MINGLDTSIVTNAAQTAGSALTIILIALIVASIAGAISWLIINIFIRR